MKKCETKKNLDNFIQNNNEKIILLYFGATWCGPCKKLKEQFNNEELMKTQFPLLRPIYIDIDNDEFEELVDIYNIESIPDIFISSNFTFKFKCSPLPLELKVIESNITSPLASI